jgi:hypothetical protein
MPWITFPEKSFDVTLISSILQFKTLSLRLNGLGYLWLNFANVVARSQGSFINRTLWMIYEENVRNWVLTKL